MNRNGSNKMSGDQISEHKRKKLEEKRSKSATERVLNTESDMLLTGDQENETMFISDKKYIVINDF